MATGVEDTTATTHQWAAICRRALRRASMLAGAVTLAATAGLIFAPPAAAVNVQHTEVVSEDPVNWTPHALDGTVYAITQVGNRVYMGGSFTQVRNSNNNTVLNLPSLVAFNATTGQIDTSFTPEVGGTVETLVGSADGQSVYVGGAFTNVNGQTRRRVARVNAATGDNWPGFTPPNISAVVKDLALVGNRLIVGGAFQTVDGATRRGLTAINAATGAADSSINMGIDGARVVNGNSGPVKVEAMDVTPDGSRLVIIGNFSTVGGQARHQVAVININTTPATLNAWATSRYQVACASGHPSYVRDIDISADGQWFVIVATGFTYAGRLCDAAARWDFGTAAPNKQPTWVNYTGGDTLLSVAITGVAVYVGGHQRWMDARDSPGQNGGVVREGIGAIHPTTGRALAWNPGKERGVGTDALYSTPTGLYIGSDTSTTAGEFHGKIAFFPLPSAPINQNTLPTAAFTASCAQLACTFNGSGSNDPDGSIAAHSWTFGDGGTASGANASRTYGTAGTYTVGLQVTDNDGGVGNTTRQVTVDTGPAASPIAFRGTAGVNANVVNPAITVPGAVQAGDGLLLFLTVNRTSATVAAPTGVTGWTSLGTVQTNGGLSTAWRKVAAAGDAGGRLTVGLDAASKVDLRLLAYAGTAAGNPVAAVATESDAGTTTNHASPTVNVTGSGRWVVTVWSDKSSTTTGWTAPGAVTVRATGLGSGSGRVTALLADSGSPVPSGNYGNLSATTNDGSRALMWTIVVAPSG